MKMLILNGKKAGLAEIRQSVYQLRSLGHDLLVRCTWEEGDVARFVDEAINLNVTRIIAGGGDGTVNELADTLAKRSRRFDNANSEDVLLPEIAILPLGTANDFATACGIPTQIDAALELAVNGTAQSIDLAMANGRYFINVASAGFGAQITVETPVELKNLLGGQAYFISGLLQAMKFTPYEGKVTARGVDGNLLSVQGAGLMGAICNGRMAGGGQQLAPHAYLNDGLLDVLLLEHFPPTALKQVVDELLDPTLDGEYVQRFQATEVEIQSTQPLPVNLDGEPTSDIKHKFSILPAAIKLVLPDDTPILMTSV
ncbi:putative diacylglycerol kinase [Shewanella sediminis HAW-EB3]|uniref:Putative diacylglycerol kinase n=1 Tax=Shewanella sediminis (strain HAW-EB3) TaxID=425104 RepID=A8FV15_SHESH|nr:lipid kinase YegS [Shewanella sediminis]ABV36688.1 putative diacylglycerol kinase [Shewanella sediminis HAW-EB3]